MEVLHLAIFAGLSAGIITFILLKFLKENPFLQDKQLYMEKFFMPIYNFFEKTGLSFSFLLQLSFLLVGFFASQMKFEEDISKILPTDKKIEKLNQVFQNSKFMDKLVVTVSLKDTARQQPDSLVAFADNFVTAIQRQICALYSKINVQGR